MDGLIGEIASGIVWRRPEGCTLDIILRLHRSSSENGDFIAFKEGFGLSSFSSVLFDVLCVG